MSFGVCRRELWQVPPCKPKLFSPEIHKQKFPHIRTDPSDGAAVEEQQQTEEEEAKAAAAVERHDFCAGCFVEHARAACSEIALAEGGVGLRCMWSGCANAIHFSESVYASE